MAEILLTDLAGDHWVDSFERRADDGGWSIVKRVLRGGRRAGVEVVHLDNGALTVEVVPTRGMSLRRGSFRGLRLGWDSPVTDGPVHPALVDQAGLGGLGWLNGFDELMVRCGLESNGPPVAEPPFTHGLHGRIGNLPAGRLAVEVPDGPAGELAVSGDVEEARLFGPRLRLSTRISTGVGSNRMTVHDTFTNLGDAPARLVVLYHWNFGPPLLGSGSRFLAPTATVAPQTPRAAEGIDGYASYGPPRVGFAEQVYHLGLLGRGPGRRTLAVLRDPTGSKGVALRFSVDQLPCFTLWKCERGPAEGYVTGLEPATNYPNHRDFEREHGRFVELAPGASHVAETTLELLADPGAVGAAEREVAELQGGAAPEVHARPAPPYAPAP